MKPTAATLRKLQDASDELRPRVIALMEACPYRLGALSVWRSYASQKYLYDGFKAGLPGFNPANPPGMSEHEATVGAKPASRAVDLDDYDDPRTFPWCHAHAEEFGLHFPYARRKKRPEPWHVESNGKPWTPPEEDALAGISETRLAEMLDELALTVTGGVRTADKQDRDVKHVSNADLLTAIERGFAAVVKAIKEKP